MVKQLKSGIELHFNGYTMELEIDSPSGQYVIMTLDEFIQLGQALTESIREWRESVKELQ